MRVSIFGKIYNYLLFFQYGLLLIVSTHHAKCDELAFFKKTPLYLLPQGSGLTLPLPDKIESSILSFLDSNPFRIQSEIALYYQNGWIFPDFRNNPEKPYHALDLSKPFVRVDLSIGALRLKKEKDPEGKTIPLPQHLEVRVKGTRLTDPTRALIVPTQVVPSKDISDLLQMPYYAELGIKDKSNVDAINITTGDSLVPTIAIVIPRTKELTGKKLSQEQFMGLLPNTTIVAPETLYVGRDHKVHQGISKQPSLVAQPSAPKQHPGSTIVPVSKCKPSQIEKDGTCIEFVSKNRNGEEELVAAKTFINFAGDEVDRAAPEHMHETRGTTVTGDRTGPAKIELDAIENPVAKSFAKATVSGAKDKLELCAAFDVSFSMGPKVQNVKDNVLAIGKIWEKTYDLAHSRLLVNEFGNETIFYNRSKPLIDSLAFYDFGPNYKDFQKYLLETYRADQGSLEATYDAIAQCVTKMSWPTEPEDEVNRTIVVFTDEPGNLRKDSVYPIKARAMAAAKGIKIQFLNPDRGAELLEYYIGKYGTDPQSPHDEDDSSTDVPVFFYQVPTYLYTKQAPDAVSLVEVNLKNEACAFEKKIEAGLLPDPGVEGSIDPLDYQSFIKKRAIALHKITLLKKLQEKLAYYKALNEDIETQNAIVEEEYPIIDDEYKKSSSQAVAILDANCHFKQTFVTTVYDDMFELEEAIAKELENPPPPPLEKKQRPLTEFEKNMRAVLNWAHENTFNEADFEPSSIPKPHAELRERLARLKNAQEALSHMVPESDKLEKEILDLDLTIYAGLDLPKKDRDQQIIAQYEKAHACPYDPSKEDGMPLKQPKPPILKDSVGDPGI